MGEEIKSMDSSYTKSTFINIIKDISILAGNNCNILPSVIGALAIKESDWGTDNDSKLTNNLFKEKVDGEWFGKCYSIKTQKYYNLPSESPEDKRLLIKVFDNARDSIQSWATYLSETRRSPDGPLKYAAIFDDTSYVSVIEKLNRTGYFKDHTRLKYDDVLYRSDIINIIENNDLYIWDNSFKEKISMSKKKRRNSNIEESANTNNSSSFEAPKHIYRVRTSWDKHDSQIFASPSYEDAKSEALKHEGYKIYIDDDGELFEDPWIEVHEAMEKESRAKERKKISGIVEVTLPQTGRPVDLKDTPVYASASINTPFIRATGRFYYYNNTIVYNRAKIAKTPNPTSIKDIYGYIILP